MWKSKLAGRDGPTRRALPAGEFFHPLSILALVLLIVNDWVLKPSSWAPSLLTGKLSDFAGLLFFPLLLTALLDCLLYGAARLGAPVDFTLRRAKLAAAIAATAFVFSALKLSVTANQAALDIAQRLGLAARVALDPSDLLALSVLWLPWRIGMAEIARVPLGRMELIQMRHQRSDVVASHSLHDIVPAGADRGDAQALIDSMDRYLDKPAPQTCAEVEASLAKLRDP
jgi:hypothetical protein